MVLVVSACSRSPRCPTCGMKIDPSSTWRAEVGAQSFDTPRCALRARTPGASVRVQEYYSGQWRDARDVRYAVGSDVIGPMGAELVPVDPARAEAFARDHHAARVVGLDDVGEAVLTDPR